jgi:hypothetical protein
LPPLMNRRRLNRRRLDFRMLKAQTPKNGRRMNAPVLPWRVCHGSSP